MVYEGDILEHALNFGIKSSSERFGVDMDSVKKIVLDFQKDIDDTPKCMCKESEKRGIRMSCFSCTLLGVGTRIQI